MIKRVNFTGRRRIPRDRVQIEVYDGSPRTFDGTINLADISFPPQAAVYLEATSAGSAIIQRFPCGKVGELKSMKNAAPSEIEGENVFFALKVVDSNERIGRILGIAENIRPERAGKQTVAGRRGILPVEPSDLGQLLWKLEFKDKDVFLLVNKDVPGLVDRARTDPHFYAMVYPEVIRHILVKAFAENVEIEEDDDHWPVMWLRFGKSVHPNNEEPPKGEVLEEERNEWIDDVVEAFSEMHKLKDKFAAAILGGNGGEQ